MGAPAIHPTGNRGEPENVVRCSWSRPLVACRRIRAIALHTPTERTIAPQSFRRFSPGRSLPSAAGIDPAEITRRATVSTHPRNSRPCGSATPRRAHPTHVGPRVRVHVATAVRHRPTIRPTSSSVSRATHPVPRTDPAPPPPPRPRTERSPQHVRCDTVLPLLGVVPSLAVIALSSGPRAALAVLVFAVSLRVLCLMGESDRFCRHLRRPTTWFRRIRRSRQETEPPRDGIR